jgi:hypothetical protein
MKRPKLRARNTVICALREKSGRALSRCDAMRLGLKAFDINGTWTLRRFERLAAARRYGTLPRFMDCQLDADAALCMAGKTDLSHG